MSFVRGLLITLIALLAGCRAERVAFQFQPVSSSAFSELPSESRLPGSCTPQSLNGARLMSEVQRRSRTMLGAQRRKGGKPAPTPTGRQRATVHHFANRRTALTTAQWAASSLRHKPVPRATADETPFYRHILTGLAVFTAGILLGIGGVKLGAYLGGIGGFFTGFAGVFLGLFLLIGSIMATIGYDAGEPFHFNVFSILGILLVSLGLSPLFGLSLALVLVPGIALLAISLGLLLTIQGLAD